MPARTKAQRKLFGIALSIKRGGTPASYSPEAAKIAEGVGEKKIREFAKGGGARGSLKGSPTYTEDELVRGYRVLDSGGHLSRGYRGSYHDGESHANHPFQTEVMRESCPK